MVESIEADPGEGSNLKKRKRANRGRKLLEGEEVEVRLSDEGLKGSWHRGVVVKCKKFRRWVQYKEILADDNVSKLVESISVSAVVEGLAHKPCKRSRGWIRPVAPLHDGGDLNVAYGMCVDCLIDDAWWEGVIFDHAEGSSQRMVFFPDQGDQHLINVSRMRLTYNWDESSGGWKLRGMWTFLKLLSKLEKKGAFPISVREIWYDLSCSKAYQLKLGEWVFGSWSTWYHLVSATIKEALSVSLGHIDNAVGVSPLTCATNSMSNDFVTDDLVNHHSNSIDKPVDGVQLITDDVSRDLAEKILPKHNRCGTFRSPKLRKHPKNKKALGDCSTRRSDHMETPSIRTKGLPVSVNNQVTKQDFLDLVAEKCCPSTPKYFKGSKRVRANAKKYLLSIGWKVRKLPCGIDFFVAPNGKWYSSLIAACIACNKGEAHGEADTGCLENSKKPVSAKPKRCSKLKIIRETAEKPGDELDPLKPMAYASEYCPEAIVTYAQHLESRKSCLEKMESNADFDFKNTSLKVKRHLVALGWSIFRKEPFGISKRGRLRYLSPAGEEFFSLPKIVAHLMDTGKHQLTPEKCRESIVGYINVMEGAKANPVGVSQEEVAIMRERVKQLLQYVGWKFYYITKGGGRELRYRSPDHKCFPSLLAACREALERIGSGRTEAAMVSGIENGDQLPPKSSTSQDTWELPDIRTDVTLSKFSGKGAKKNKNRTRDDLPSAVSFKDLHDSPAKRPKSSGFCYNNKKTKKRKLSGASGTNIANPSTASSVPRFVKKAQKTMPSLSHTPRTVLSWLIQSGAVKLKQRVRYLRKKGGEVLMEGCITHKGIKCRCCKIVHTLTNFESHAGSTNHRPSAYIFLQDGRSLLECQRQLIESVKPKDFPHKRIKTDYSVYPSDAICSICQDGGTLVLCDHCPSSFHLECVGLEDIPKGKWFCASCKCSICGLSDFNSDLKKFTPDTKLFCDQCEREYHVRCLQGELSGLTRCPEGYWFCSKTCSEIFCRLRKLVGVSNSTEGTELSWTILRARKENEIDFSTSDKEARAEGHSKLHIALDVLHECFVTIIEPRTKTDLVADLLYNKESELNRLNFWGFYTMILEKGDEIVSVATFRVYGDEVAEMPLIGTRVQYRRKGMCRLLVNELEKLLDSMGVKKLLLPAIPDLLETWTKSFGFTVMSQSDKLMLSQYTFLGFQSTKLCQKSLKSSLRTSEKLIGNVDDVEETVECSNMVIDHDNSTARDVTEQVPYVRLPCVSAAPCILRTKAVTVGHQGNSGDSFPVTNSSDDTGALQHGDSCLQKELTDRRQLSTAPVEIDCECNFAGTTDHPSPMVKSICNVGCEIATETHKSHTGNNIKDFFMKSRDTFKYFYKRRVLAS